MPSSTGLCIKGKHVQGAYESNLVDLFYRGWKDVVERKEAVCLWRQYVEIFPWLNCDILDEVFPPEILRECRTYVRYPCVMKDAPEDKVRLNLQYQDTRLKLGIEECMKRGYSPIAAPVIAHALSAVYALLLRIAIRESHPVWQYCTENDLDALTYILLDRYDPARRGELLREGHLANERSLEALHGLLMQRDPDIKDFLGYQIHAGTIWWDHEPPFTVANTGLVINDYGCFAAEVLSGPRRLVFLFDDNGELVWDLMMIQKLLQCNSDLDVLGVVSTEIVSNNANRQTVSACLTNPIFSDLRLCHRFRLFDEKNIRSAIDPSFCSQELLDAIRRADIIFIKGVSFFEAIQELETTCYYGFVVHSLDSQRCTGLQKGNGVFVRVPTGQAGFAYGKSSLKDRYPDLRQEYERSAR